MDSSVKPSHIMLVEDNPADVYLVRKTLEENGAPFELTCFEDGQAAVRALMRQGNQPPDLILLDLNLPEIEGIAVLRTIRNMPKLAETPVAILTSSQSPQDMQRAATIGATRYITKPVMPEDFLREVGQGIKEILLHGGAN